MRGKEYLDSSYPATTIKILGYHIQHAVQLEASGVKTNNLTTLSYVLYFRARAGLEVADAKTLTKED